MSRHKIKKGLNHRLVLVATFNESITNGELINRSGLKPEKPLASLNHQTTHSPLPQISSPNPRTQSPFLTMFEPTNLVPNLNEITEEYTEREEETI